MTAPGDIERDLQVLASELRKLEAEYTMYFGGRLPRPPHESRARVEALMKRLDRGAFDQLAQRFRFQTLQSRFATFAELWDRGQRSREVGHARPHAQRTAEPAAPPPDAERLVHEVVLEDVRAQSERLETLYEAVMDARRDAGELQVPYHRFAELVRDQVQQFRDDGIGEVKFRVTVSEGKVRLTARATKQVEQ